MDDKQFERKVVFDQELFKLKQSSLITEEEYKKIKYAHVRYYEDIELNKSKLKNNEAGFERANPKIPTAPKLHKISTPQEIRERNISWILIVGVVLVLMSGLVLATSTWKMMNNTFKTILISLIAILFFGISLLTDKVLKIEKTSFAFWVLGSLFLPVIILSAGYFKLFGQYLSIFGEGKYMLGAIGAAICLPVYLYTAKRYNNRLFVWISLITISSGDAFLLASMDLKIDLFYFGIVLYNGVLLYVYNWLRNNEHIKLFTVEIPVFAQINLILSTLFMMYFYDNAVFYGFNIILTAVLYIYMVFAKGRKEYIYVFSGLVVYGIYQITENSFLSNIDLLIFAMIGFVFVGTERYLKKEKIMQRTFNYINAFISVLAFVYISLEGIFIRIEQSSWVLLLAYVAIALNYLYLSNRTQNKLFEYLTPIFLVSASYQCYIIIQKYINVNVESIAMLGIGSIMFIFLYFKNKFKYLQPIKESGCLISLVVIMWAINIGIRDKQLILAASEFVVLGISFYIIYKLEAQEVVKKICKFAVPSAWFISALILTMKIGADIRGDSNIFEEPYDLLAAVIITFGLGYLWQRYDNSLKKPFNYVAHILMPLSILTILIMHNDEPYAFILITGIYVYSLFKCHSEWKKKVFLYASFTTGIMSVYSAIVAMSEVVRLLQLYKLSDYSLAFGSILISAIWYYMNTTWKEKAAYYIVPFNMLALCSLTILYPFQYISSILLLVCVGIEVYMMYYYKLQILHILPLLIFIEGLNQFMNFEFKQNILAELIILAVFVFIIKFIGEFFSKRLYGKYTERKLFSVYFDWFVVMTLVLTAEIADIIRLNDRYSEWGDMIAPIILVYIVYSQIKRVPSGMASSITKTITVFSLLVPYYTLMWKLYDSVYVPTIYKLVETELILLPWIIIVIFLSKKVWKGYEHITRKVEMGLLIIAALLLCRDLAGVNQLKEGLILGVFSLVSIIGGMQFKKKSFFFVGSGTIIFNMFVQTRDFWGNLPWWVYLLAAGMILIITASLNEMQKNKKVIKIDRKALLDKFKDWN